MVNNASAISLTPTPQTDMKRFDLMHQINTRGTFMVSKYAIPHLEKAENPHILMLSPPLDMSEKWFAPHLAYSLAKYGMSLCVLGLAGELRAKRHRRQRAVAAHHHRHERDQEPARRRCASCRRAARREILADAAHAIFEKPREKLHRAISSSTTSFLSGEGVTDFERYRVDPSVPLAPDFFVPDDTPPLSSLRQFDYPLLLDATRLSSPLWGGVEMGVLAITDPRVADTPP